MIDTKELATSVPSSAWDRTTGSSASRPFKLGLAIIAFGIVAVGAAILISERALPFDEAFRGCAEDEAELRLVVTYSVNGITDHEEFVAYYRRRDPEKKRSFSELLLGWWKPTTIVLEDVGGYDSRAGQGCACGGDQSFFTSYHLSAWENATGVDLDIKHDRSTGGKETTVEETIAIPFGQPVAGQKGEVHYDAAWEKA